MRVCEREAVLLARQPAPTRRGVVYLLFQGDEVVYVGQTMKLPVRLAVHREKIAFDSYVAIDAEALTDAQRRKLERDYIMEYLPRLNQSPRELTAARFLRLAQELAKEGHIKPISARRTAPEDRTTYRVSPDGDSILQRLAAWHGVSKAAALELTLRQAAREHHMQPLEPQP